MRALNIEICWLAHGQGLALPAYQTEQAAGVDLAAAVADGAQILIEPGGRALIPTGFSLALPPGYEAQIRPRSGLALKHGITVLNAPGTIDADYRGEVQVLLINLGQNSFTIHRGMRIAQMIVAPVVQGEFVAVDDLADSMRGTGGFGSTGTQGA